MFLGAYVFALAQAMPGLSGDSVRYLLPTSSPLWRRFSRAVRRLSLKIILSTKFSTRAYRFPVMSHTRGEYTSLPQDEDEGRPNPTGPGPQCDSDHGSAPIPADHCHSDGIRASSVSFSQRLIRWSILFIVTCTVIDAMALAYLALLSAQNVFFSRSGDCAAAAPEEAELELRSSYVNFDRLYGEGSTLRPAPHAPIVNHVLALAHVSLVQPHAVVTRNPGGGMTINGYVPLDARRLWVTDDVSPRLPLSPYIVADAAHRRKVSTIVQFRAIDYGMENCSLALAPAPSAEGAAAAVDIELDVWALADAPRRPGRRLNANLDVRTLTWASRPERKEHIGMLSMIGGAPGETRVFACPSGSYHTLEIACATTRGCDVDILGVGHGESGVFPPFSFTCRGGHVLSPEPVWRFLLTGIYVKQYQTL